MRRIIFDVDGTLLNSYALDTKYFCRAVLDVLGPVTFRPDWGDYEHVSDAGILAAILLDNGFGDDREAPGRVRARFGELVSAEVSGKPCAPIAGASEMLRIVRGRADLDIGIATGGWSHSAQAKLTSAGLDTEGVPLASSDDHPARVEIMKHCAARLEGSDERPVYVGDGEWDAAACADLGWAFIGIGDRLKGQCPVWIPNYAVVDLTEQIEHALAACNGDWVRA